VDFQIRITEAALADFQEILAYSWANFPGSADRFGNALLNHLDILKSFPYIGSPVTNSPNVRQLAHTPILIYYRVREETRCVEVLHFWHGSRQKRPSSAEH
jgi:plasmid stabilization system protein ParE